MHNFRDSFCSTDSECIAIGAKRNGLLSEPAPANYFLGAASKFGFALGSTWTIIADDVAEDNRRHLTGN
jgi:hypothetical protein